MKLVFSEFCQTTSILLINRFQLFKYSEAIFSVYTEALTLTLAQSINLFTLFVISVLLPGKSPFSSDIKTLILKQKKLVNELVEHGIGLFQVLPNYLNFLINRFQLFKCSEAIFSVSPETLTLTLAQNINLFKLFVISVLLPGKSPFFWDINT